MTNVLYLGVLPLSKVLKYSIKQVDDDIRTLQKELGGISLYVPAILLVTKISLIWTHHPDHFSSLYSTISTMTQGVSVLAAGERQSAGWGNFMSLDIILHSLVLVQPSQAQPERESKRALGN